MIGNPLKIIQFLYDQDKTKIFEIKEHKEKRNKDQNSKYWKLVNELSLKLKLGVEEVHKELLRKYSPRTQILVPSEYTLRGIEYYDKKSRIKKGDNYFDVYYVYTPSHEMTTSEFAILLEGLCEECKQQGIETLSPDELKELRSLYENEEKSSN